MNLLPAIAPASLSARKRRVTRRKGYISLLSILLIVIGVATLVLVVDWAFLVFSSRRTLQLTDTLALTAVNELLDEGLLLDNPMEIQADDVTAASATTSTFLGLNNQALASQLQAAPGDLSVTAGRVENTSLAVSGGNAFDPGSGGHLNSLRVEIFQVGGVELLMRGFGAPETAKISGSSIATLDSRVVGYRPQIGVNSPVAPLAIFRDDWENTRVVSPVAIGVNGRNQFDFVLLYTTATSNTDFTDGTSNAALVNVNGSALTNSLPSLGTLQSQIENGITTSDVNNGLLGPFAPGAPDSLYAENISPSTAVVDGLAMSFNTVAASNNNRRVFPLYNTGLPDGMQDLDITGFIAATVIEAQSQPGPTPGSRRLRVRLEPEFVIHITTETSFQDANSNTVPENTYCHKIRLTR